MRFEASEKRFSRACPECGEIYGPTDGLTVVRTRMGRRIEGLVFPVTVWWTGLFLVFCIGYAAFWPVEEGSKLQRGVAWFVIGVPLIPGMILSLVSWFFPYVRIFRCRSCGATDEVALKEEGS